VLGNEGSRRSLVKNKRRFFFNGLEERGKRVGFHGKKMLETIFFGGVKN